MKIKQLSIFLENKPGHVKQACKVLKDANINMTALSLADTTEFGILRLIIDDVAHGKEAFSKAGYVVSETDVIAMEIPNIPGSLEDILGKIADAGVNIDYMYAFSLKGFQNALMVFRFRDVDKAIEALKDSKIHMIKSSDLFG